jgi:diguanylate cyclase (GGDEF)-like protein
LPARFGGEEFCVLSHSEPELALKIAERIRLAVEQSSWAKRAVTVSIGVCSLEGANIEEGALFQRADAALYRAKAQGRNCVVVA